MFRKKGSGYCNLFLRIASVIELPTWLGGMGLNLTLECKARKMQLVSIDHHDQVRTGRDTFLDLGASSSSLTYLPQMLSSRYET
jgi:hypothetical protein